MWLVLSRAIATLQQGFLTMGPLHFQAVLIEVAYFRPQGLECVQMLLLHASTPALRQHRPQLGTPEKRNRNLDPIVAK